MLKRVYFILFLSLLCVWSPVGGASSEGLSNIILVERLNISKSYLNDSYSIDNGTEDGCFQFFPLYFSEIPKTDREGNKEGDFLSSVKYMFLSWMYHSNSTQIVNSTDHVLSPSEKLSLISSLRESDSQSLVVTEKYIIYSIVFKEIFHQSQVYNVLNACGHPYMQSGEIEFGIGKSVEIPNEQELLRLESNGTLAQDGKELGIEEDESLGLMIGDHSGLRDPLDLDNQIQDFESLENRQTSSSFVDEQTSHKSNMQDSEPEQVSNNQDVVNEHVDKNLEKPLKSVKSVGELRGSCGGRGGVSRRGGRRVRMRGGKTRSVYKVDSCHFYLDRSPVVSNRVYHYRK
ncbi:hypothetical protein OJ253_123 [Cryptosporidium canis]|uniref:Signal peptide-containing protein n=1 Tax=Cryptosporidium canis TaxID=195482 RepID=A0A9D5DK83_9CRYT|nr:hypothetical protein OJ253_123 [Cryptosporidium canis]